MNQQELESLRVKLQSHAKDTLLQWLVRRTSIAEGLQPDDLRAPLRAAADEDLRRLHKEFLQLTFSKVSAVESDLLAAEAQEAFETVSLSVRDSLAVLGGQ